LEELAAAAGVPVWNGLTDEWHPTQALCDMLTMREHTEKPDEQVAFAYCGDARNNVGNSLLVVGALMGMDVRMVAPMSLQNHDDVVEAAQAVATQTGARLLQSDDVAEGVSGVDFVTPTCGFRWASRRQLG
jgi:ornithine carbamoyltransferase